MPTLIAPPPLQHLGDRLYYCGVFMLTGGGGGRTRHQILSGAVYVLRGEQRGRIAVSDRLRIEIQQACNLCQWTAKELHSRIIMYFIVVMVVER